LADGDHRVERVWAKAVARFHARPPATDAATVMGEIAEIRQAAEARPRLWGGQGGASQRAVLEAFFTVAGEALRLDPTVSLRQLADMTTFSDSATHRAVAKLVAADWLRIEAGAGVRLDGFEDAAGGREAQLEARRYRIRIPDVLPEPLSDDDLADPRTGELASVGWARGGVHDTFTYRGLGPVAGLIYARLSTSSPAAATLLSTRVGYRPATVRGHLRRLEKWGLAVWGPHGWTRGGRDLDEVAEELGVAGTRAERADKHREDREKYLDWATGWANRRGYRDRRRNRHGRLLYRPDGVAERLELAVEPPEVTFEIPPRRYQRAA
jgi:DNA-binding MarR family transcriptional regulator